MGDCNINKINLAILYARYILGISFIYIGGRMKKLIDFKEMWQAIQHYADKNCDGNFNQAVRRLVKSGLKQDD